MKKITIIIFLLGSAFSNAQAPCDGSSPWFLGGNTGAGSKAIGTCDKIDFILKSNDTNRVWIKADGRILFGSQQVKTGHPHANSFVQVNGKLACKELVIVDPSKWSDFVFKNDYRLMPLRELETYYKVNKHLPDVPSESEVKENGINSADMDALLLQKIEELTLYVVEINKRLESLVKENSVLKAQVNCR